MHKKNFYIIIFSLLIVSLFLRPTEVKALNINFSDVKKDIKIGDEVLIKVSIDTKGKEINTIEGTLKIKGDALVSGINTEKSIFTLWPEKPQLNKDEISFVGGTPGGVYGSDLRLFDFVFVPKSAGDVSFSSDDMQAYLNDGQGTKLIADPVDFKIKLEQNKKTNTNLFYAIIILLFIKFFYNKLKRKNEK